MNTGGEDKVQERERLKSVPPTADEAGGASAALSPTDKVGLAAGGAQSGAVKAALGALRIYKVYLSAHMPGGCRFEPTCSMYAYQAIERFGVLRGTWLGLKRLLRCHPLSRRFGYDPAPEKAEVEALKTAEAEQDAGRAGVSPREAHS